MTSQRAHRNQGYDKPKSLQGTFEFLNTLTIPKKSVRNVVYQNGQSDRDGELTNSNCDRRGNQGTGEQSESKMKEGPSAERPCLICGAHDHWVKDCQDADKDESKASSKKKNKNKKITSLLVLPADTLDNHDLSDVSELLDNVADEAPRQVAVGDSVLLACGKSAFSRRSRIESDLLSG